MHVIQTHRRGLHPLRFAKANLPPQLEVGEVPRPIKGWTGLHSKLRLVGFHKQLTRVGETSRNKGGKRDKTASKVGPD